MDYTDLILPLVTALLGILLGRGWPILKSLAATTPTKVDDALLEAIEMAVARAVANVPIVQVAPPAITVTEVKS